MSFYTKQMFAQIFLTPAKCILCTAEQGFVDFIADWCSTVKSSGIDFSGVRALTKDMVCMCEEVFFSLLASDHSFIYPRSLQNIHIWHHYILSNPKFEQVTAPDLRLNKSLSQPWMQTKTMMPLMHHKSMTASLCLAGSRAESKHFRESGVE